MRELTGLRPFLLLLSLVAGAGCRRAPAPAPRTELTVATRADVTGVFPNPPYQAEVFSIDVNANIFDSLVRFDRDLRVLPALAERWENPDELTWVFHLGSGARFSSGEPVRASDVAASLRTTIRRNSPLLAEDSVEAQGDDRVVIRTRRRFPHLLAHLQSAFILSESALARVPVPPIGSGPYKLVRWSPGRRLLLARNPFFLPAPAFERVRLSVIPSADERIDALLSGRAQIADVIPPERVAALQRAPNVRVISEPSLRVLYLALRVDRAPFSDIRVRRAVRLAIDQKELIRSALHGLATPAKELVAPQVFGYEPGIPETTPDVPAARRLLAEAGYPEGLDVPLDAPSDRFVNDVQILEEVRRQLLGAGIRVTVRTMPKSRYFPYLQTEASRFYLLAWTCNTLFGGDALEELVRTRGAGGQGDFNWQGIRDPELDRLTDESRESADSQARLDATRKAMALIAEKELIVPLLVPHDTIAVSRELAWEPEKGLALRFAQMRPAAETAAPRQAGGREKDKRADPANGDFADYPVFKGPAIL